MVKVAPSILSVEPEKWNQEIIEIQNAGADYIHIDVMDGNFVENITPGTDMLMAAHDASEITIDTHLMVEEPEKWLDEFSLSNIITFHIEAVDQETAEKIIEELHEREIKVGIAIKPDTPVEEIIPYLEKVDLILVMLVEPGYGGQQMIEECLDKVKFLKEIKPVNLEIEVDGGINLENVQRVKEAGAEVIVAGTAIVNATDKAEVIRKIKED